MMKVKAFEEVSLSNLENSINNWFNFINDNEMIKVIDIKFETDKGSLYAFHALVWYKIDNV